MIRINLLGEKIDRSGSYVLQALGGAVVVFFALFLSFMLYDSVASQVAALQDEESQLKIELARLEKVTKEVEELEKKRKLLTDKLRTIATLKAKKTGPVRILDDINLAVPERAWLEGITQKGQVLEIKGVALDNQTIALFMKNLEQGKFVSSVDLVVSSELVKDDVKLKEFTLSLNFKDPIEVRNAEDKAKQEQANQQKT